MDLLILTVRAAMTRPGEGLAVIGNPSDSCSVMLSRGEQVELRRHDGKVLKAKIQSAKVPVSLSMGYQGLLLSSEISEADVPSGTEVWFEL